MLGCTQVSWSLQKWMKVCLNNLEMFYSREKSTELIVNQQNDIIYTYRKYIVRIMLPEIYYIIGIMLH